MTAYEFIRVRSLRVVAALSIVLVGSAVQAQTFHGHGYTFRPEPGWTMVSSPSNGVDAQFYATPIEHFAPNVVVVVTSLVPGETIDVIQTYVRVHFPSTFANFHLIDMHESKVGRLPAVLIASTQSFGTPARPYRLIEEGIIGKDHCYTFSCIAPLDVYSRYATAFDRMLASIKMDP